MEFPHSLIGSCSFLQVEEIWYL
uniref:Uncharacterized protein n=1 Tax=Arundo donax TaxID=35708 RepID=A0A0A9Q173_ARUDO